MEKFNDDDFLIRKEKYDEKEILSGILFLIKEYYIGDFYLKDNRIYMSFENGQQFAVQVNQIDSIKNKT